MSEEWRLSVAMGLVAELACALGVRGINALPGPWVHKVDEHWTVAVNATKTEQRAAADNICADILIKPYEMAVWWNGWRAGILTPFGGIFAAGELANEETFCAAVRAAIVRGGGFSCS